MISPGPPLGAAPGQDSPPSGGKIRFLERDTEDIVDLREIAFFQPEPSLVFTTGYAGIKMDTFDLRCTAVHELIDFFTMNPARLAPRVPDT